MCGKCHMVTEMKKTIGRIAKAVLALLAVVLVLVGALAIYHHSKLPDEEARLLPPGKLVSVSGKNMHVYTEGPSGSGEPTLVFLSGSGVAAPVYDYKVLYSRFSSRYPVAVVEKFGYGYSDLRGQSRDVEEMVEENRAALSQAGQNAPYILFPHSMSALEALYWAHTYPEEVKAIVGLDMAVPETYSPYTEGYGAMKAMRAATFFGLHRIPLFNPVSERGLTEEETEQHKILCYTVTLNEDVMNEAAAVNENALKVRELGTPEIPILSFVSSGMGEQWDQSQQNFAGSSSLVQMIRLDCGHNIHYFETDRIEKESKAFIEGLPD